jgi:hypothetical protein
MLGLTYHVEFMIKKIARHQWFTSIILDTQEAEIKEDQS